MTLHDGARALVGVASENDLLHCVVRHVVGLTVSGLSGY
jgi:hypothetical protein